MIKVWLGWLQKDTNSLFRPYPEQWQHLVVLPVTRIGVKNGDDGKFTSTDQSDPKEQPNRWFTIWYNDVSNLIDNDHVNLLRKSMNRPIERNEKEKRRSIKVKVSIKVRNWELHLLLMKVFCAPTVLSQTTKLPISLRIQYTYIVLRIS